MTATVESVFPLTDSEEPTAVPSNGQAQVSIDDDSSTTTYDLSTSAFTFGFEAAIQTASNDKSFGSVVTYFSVDTAVDYAISGFFTAVSSDGRTIALDALLDDGADPFLFFNSQISVATPNESFVLGEEGGDFSNMFPPESRNMTGTLLPGIEYLFSVDTELSNGDSTRGDPATASGTVTLTFNPEPPTPTVTPTVTPTPRTTPTPTATPTPPAPTCQDIWKVVTIHTIGKGQSPTNNAKLVHSIKGNIIDPESLGDTHRIPVCSRTRVEVVVTDTSGAPTLTASDDGIVCTGSTCVVESISATEKYVARSADGADTDRITLLPQ